MENLFVFGVKMVTTMIYLGCKFVNLGQIYRLLCLPFLLNFFSFTEICEGLVRGLEDLDCEMIRPSRDFDASGNPDHNGRATI